MRLYRALGEMMAEGSNISMVYVHVPEGTDTDEVISRFKKQHLIRLKKNIAKMEKDYKVRILSDPDYAEEYFAMYPVCEHFACGKIAIDFVYQAFLSFICKGSRGWQLLPAVPVRFSCAR